MRSFGMLTARAFWITRRRVGFAAGSGPLALTDIVMSLAMRANCFAMRFHRANIVCLRTSNMRPMDTRKPERPAESAERRMVHGEQGRAGTPVRRGSHPGGKGESAS